MSKFLSQKRIGAILVASMSIIVVALLIIPPYSFIIRINGEAWHVTGTKAVQEWDYSFYMFGVDGGERTILYPGLGYDRFLEINITSLGGTINLSVEYAGETLYDVNDASEVIVTLPVNSSSNPRVAVSPYWSNNMTLEGYIKAYCWIPNESISSYYWRSLFGGGD